jgi:hypothetical protein
MSKERRLTIAGSLALAAGLLCYGHFTFTERQIAELNAHTKEIKDQVASLESLRKQSADLAAKRDKSRAELQALSDKVADCSATLAAHRLRWQKLLVLLAENRPQHLLVQKIDSSGERLNITGVCLSASPANELAADLESQLKELGWRVQPARQRASKALANGDPWKFELSFKDFLPQSNDTAPAAPQQPNPPRPGAPRAPENKLVSVRDTNEDGQP